MRLKRQYLVTVKYIRNLDNANEINETIVYGHKERDNTVSYFKKIYDWTEITTYEILVDYYGYTRKIKLKSWRR